MRKRVSLLTILIILTLSLVHPMSARAAWGNYGWGPRVGLTVGPDQVHVGLHLIAGRFAERFSFQPNLEVGVGDHATLIALNADVAYRFYSSWDRWSPYAGGGISILRSDRNADRFDSRRSNARADLGAAALGGIETTLRNGNRMFIETKLGLTDAPDLKIAVGWIGR
jgi:opacity protein-like surface antigen